MKPGKKIDAPNQNPVNIIPDGHNEELAKQRDYQQDQSNNKASNDASAARNTGANGYTQRSNQKDQLENLHIGGDETHPQGGNNHTTAGEQAQGPGFTEEGKLRAGRGHSDERPEARRRPHQRPRQEAPGRRRATSLSRSLTYPKPPAPQQVSWAAGGFWPNIW